MIEFLNQWQTLVGAITGPVLGILLAALGFWIKSKFSNYLDRKRAYDRVEIYIAKSVTDFHKAQKELLGFCERLRELIESVQSHPAESFSLDATDFSYVAVFEDRELLFLNTKSNYLHNLILGVSIGIEHANSTIDNYRNEFLKLQERNQFIVGLKEADAAQQKAMYAQNLTILCNTVERYAHSMDAGFEDFMKIRIYNRRLQDRPVINRWWHEGISFKFFKNKKAINDYLSTKVAQERIDRTTKHEVEGLVNMIGKQKAD